LNKSGVIAPGDPTAKTDASGQYVFSNVTTNADYVVAAIAPTGYKLSAPSFSLRPGANINTSKRLDEQSETAVAIDPTNPNRVFVMSNTFDTFNGMSASYSNDGGTTWTNRLVATGSDGLEAANGDPVAVFDKFGNLWICYLSNSGASIVGRSLNGGQTFAQFAAVQSGGIDQPSLVTGPSSTSGRIQLVEICNFGFGQFVSYLEVAASGPIGTFTTPILVPGSSTGISGQFGDPCIGPNGQVAIVYQNSGSGSGPDNIYFNFDPDGIGPQPMGARKTVTSTNVGAFFAPPAQPFRSIDAEVDLEWDVSAGPHNGRLYLLYTDSPSVGNNDTNIFLRFSDDNGTTWSNRVRVNDDATNRTQMLPRMSLDQTTGNLAITWHDCRSDANNTKTEYWGTMSTDGGLSFLPNIKLSTGQSTSGFGGNDYGDYSAVSFVNGRFIAAWSDNSNSTNNNPNGTIDFKDIYIAKVNVANNLNNYYVSATAGQVYTGLNFGLDFSGQFVVNLTGKPQAVQISGMTGGFNRLTIYGTPTPDEFTISSSIVTTSAGAVISFTNIQELTVNGLNGADTFFSQATPFAVFVNGGNPMIGSGDRLAVSTPDAIEFPTSPTNGSFTFPSGGAPLSYTGLELSVLASTLPPGPLPPRTSFAIGSGMSSIPIASLYRTGRDTPTYSIMAYDPSFRGGVRVASGDVNGDGTPDLITAAGPTGGPHVQVFNGLLPQPLLGPVTSFFAYDPGFAGGVWVAAGDVNGDKKADIITGADAGGGPHVKVFDASTGKVLLSFFAYSPGFVGGVRVAAGDVNGDGKADIITAPGQGGGPHVRVFSGANGQIIREYFAYDPSFTGGVLVSADDVNGDGFADIATGTGQGGGPLVTIRDSATGNQLHRFYAFPPITPSGLTSGQAVWSSGVRVALADSDGDGIVELFAGPGQGRNSILKAFLSTTGAEVWSKPPTDPTYLGGMVLGS